MVAREEAVAEALMMGLRLAEGIDAARFERQTGVPLADAVDAFCERIAFSPAQTARVFERARSLGLAVKLHADQLSDSGGAALAARYGALSADHLEYTNESGVQAMAKAGTVAVLLPGAFYFLREKQLPPIEALRAHRVPIAIATDCNPGSSPVTSILLMLNMACTLFRLTPEEALAGVTCHAARALGHRAATDLHPHCRTKNNYCESPSRDGWGSALGARTAPQPAHKRPAPNHTPRLSRRAASPLRRSRRCTAGQSAVGCRVRPNTGAGWRECVSLQLVVIRGLVKRKLIRPTLGVVASGYAAPRHLPANVCRGLGRCGQASKGVWGMSWRREAQGRDRRRNARGSGQVRSDPGVPEPTGGTETSQYP